MSITKSSLLPILLAISSLTIAQTIQDDFEGNGNITTWFGDNAGLNTSFNNPLFNNINPSSKVLQYRDQGAQYANVRFDAGRNLNLSSNSVFSFKIYIPSSSITGNQNNQVSVKLQDGGLGAPWSTQSEIIKPISLNQWQTISVDFASDPYINLDPNSPPPAQRTDFNRVLIQINGEANSDQVTAYIDDFYYFDSVPPTPVFNNLVWADEFNGSGPIDPTKWHHQTQLPNGGSWFNGEIQHYTNRTANSYQANGYLNLIAKRETFTDQGHTKQFTSARLNSKFAFTEGRIEVRAQLPTGVGTWPAIWMLGKNINETGAYWQTQGFGTTGWPACGEIDIMEHWGNNQNFVQSAMHTPSSSGATINHGGQMIPTASTVFHVYELEWTSSKMVFSVDGNVHYTYDPAVKDASTWPFFADQFILLNIAIQPSIASSFTQSSMLIDYVRVYQQGSVSLIENEYKTKMSLFPNPVIELLNIELNQNHSEVGQLSIYSVAGKLIRSENISLNSNKVTIDKLNNLESGIYFINLIVDQKVYNQKFYKL